MKTNSILTAGASLLLLSGKGAEPETYDQKALYVKYGIDTMITIDEDQTIYTIFNDKGDKIEEITLYNNDKTKEPEADYGLDSALYYTKHTMRFEYKDGNLVKTMKSNDDRPFTLIYEIEYDKRGRSTSRKSYVFKDTPCVSVSNYYYGNKVISYVTDFECELVYKSVDELNKKGKVVKTTGYDIGKAAVGVKETLSLTEERTYDKYGNC